MYGSADGSVTGGASKCLEDIMDTGINKEYYFKHASCQKIKQDILAATPFVIDNYCMPVVEVKYKKEGAAKKPAAGN